MPEEMGAPVVQVFVHPKSQVSRKAERFLKERGVRFSAVDVRRKPPSPGELRKWVQRFGVDAVVDATSKTYQDKGLRYLSAPPEEWIRRLADEPTLIALPLIACGSELAVGDDPDGWARIVTAAKT